MPISQIQRALASILTNTSSYNLLLKQPSKFGKKFKLSQAEITALYAMDHSGIALYRKRLSDHSTHWRWFSFRR
jgi:hypothetical protein